MSGGSGFSRWVSDRLVNRFQVIVGEVQVGMDWLAWNWPFVIHLQAFPPSFVLKGSLDG